MLDEEIKSICNQLRNTDLGRAGKLRLYGHIRSLCNALIANETGVCPSPSPDAHETSKLPN